MIKGQWGQRVSSPRENHEADAIARALRNKCLNHRLDRLQAIQPIAIALVILR